MMNKKTRIQSSFKSVRAEYKEIGLVSFFLGLGLIVNIPALYAWDKALMAMFFSFVAMAITFFTIDYFVGSSQTDDAM